MYRVVLRYGSQVFQARIDEQLTIGSGVNADLRIPVDEVSRKHAQIVQTDGKFVLRDLESRNGVFIDGERIEEAEVEPFIEFSLGPVRGVIQTVSTEDVMVGLDLGDAAGEADALYLTQEMPGLTGAFDALAQLCNAAPPDQPVLAAAVCELVAGLSPECVIAIEETEADAVLGAAGDLRRLDDAAASATSKDGHVRIRWIVPGAPPQVDSVMQLIANHVAGASLPTTERPEADLEPTAHIVGTSAPTREMLRRAHLLARQPINVLLLGESGTGKELLAREIHEHSPRRDAPFVAVNCAALARDLLEAELFGIEEGVATGVSARAGHFERAHGGTLLLDEVCDMSVATQAALLRVLQENVVYRVGGREPHEADVRVIAATNKDIGEEMESGRFRSDLYYRLATATIRVPALRDRPGDVPVLTQHFLQRVGREFGRNVRGVSQKALQLLMHYGWPGNVRELENEIRRLVAIVPVGGLVEASMLGETIRGGVAPGSIPTGTDGLVETLSSVERRLILEAIAAADGNLAAAARALGISRGGLYQRMARLGIERDDD